MLCVISEQLHDFDPKPPILFLGPGLLWINNAPTQVQIENSLYPFYWIWAFVLYEPMSKWKVLGIAILRWWAQVMLPILFSLQAVDWSVWVGLGVQGRFEALSIQVEELHLYISVSKFNLHSLYTNNRSPVTWTTQLLLSEHLLCRRVDICHAHICNEWNSIVLMNRISIFIMSQC